jgi:putative ABC transport system substrate-binding protein
MCFLYKRREFITLLGGAAAAWPLAARAQQAAFQLVGFLSSGSMEADGFRLTAFHQGLNQTGIVEGRDVMIEYRGAEDRYDRLPMLAEELVKRSVTAIAAAGVAAARAAKSASATVPIVFVTGVDPIALGLVASLSRPGGNLTGVTDLTTELGPKHLELLHECLPKARSLALLINPSRSDAESISRELQELARTRGMQMHVLRASSERDLAIVFDRLRELQVAGLVISADALFNSQSEQLAHLAASRGVPAIHVVRQFATAGGLMSYGGGLTEAYRQIVIHIGRILKGERPADLPVQQSTKVELVINLKAAKALGLDVPPTLLARADEVIE